MLSTAQVSAQAALPEIMSRLRSGVDDLNPDTPGGAAMVEWSRNGFSTDKGTLENVALAAAEQSKSPTIRAAAKGAKIAGSVGATVGMIGGPVVSAVAGLAASAVGAAVGAIVNVSKRRKEAGQDLRDAQVAAEQTLRECVRAIGAAYHDGFHGTLPADTIVGMIKQQMALAGAAGYADKIWGPFDPRSACCHPRICRDGGFRINPAEYRGVTFPHYGWFQYRILGGETHWALKGRYGDCVNDGDIDKGGAWSDKVTTRRKRTERMLAVASAILDATQRVVAAMINVADAKEKAEQYYSGKQYKVDIERAAAGMRATSKSYAEAMRKMSLCLKQHCGMTSAQISKVLPSGPYLETWQDCARRKLRANNFSSQEIELLVDKGCDAVNSALYSKTDAHSRSLTKAAAGARASAKSYGIAMTAIGLKSKYSFSDGRARRAAARISDGMSRTNAIAIAQASRWTERLAVVAAVGGVGYGVYRFMKNR